ncbi:hypothetical protein ACQKP7_02205 [Pseudomonas frederiksbergensis]|uniref:hypothetical protein n=1 Tax=Pseudomonas frederiksbergensis TaxID=104087 RepID=UPI003D07D08F
MKSGLIAFSMALLTGCSGVDIIHEKYDENDKNEGYVFYASKALFVRNCNIDSNGTATYSDDIKYVPDYSQPYTLKIKNRLGDNNVKAEFTNGWMLTSINGDYKSPEATVDKAMDIVGKSLGNPLVKSQDVKAKLTAVSTCEGFICDLKDINMTNFDSSRCKTITNRKVIEVDVTDTK